LNPTLRRTALHAVHKQMGAKMVDFGGWDMPVEYGGLVREHLAVRTAAGLFDVSHMGEIRARGPQALALLQRVTCNDISKLAVNQAHYNCLMYPQGTIADDLLVYRLAEDDFLLVVNAANTEKDFAWITSQNTLGATVENASDAFSLLALQGPRAAEILQPLTEVPLAELKYYWRRDGQVAGVTCGLARTGYTGEDCFELFFAPEHTEKLWHTLLEAGKAAGILPCGLGARNTLRLEAGMALYGHEIDATHTPLEANLGRYVKLDKGDFLGRDTLARQKEQGVTRKLVGLEMVERGIARDGYPVYLEGGGEVIGWITSGSPAPFLKKNIAFAYVPAAVAETGGRLAVGVRGQRVAAQIVTTPFYKRKK
jgi:aminomethyltransferase